MQSLELEWIQWIHQFRTPLLDHFFLFLRFFDRQEFFFVLIPIVWLNYGWKNGLRLFYILFFCAILNNCLKEFFASLRPCSFISELGLYPIDGYGFPSGAAQTTMVLSGLFIYFQKNPWKWAIAITYFLLISFSRIYLGVHFPSDILGGWFFGFAFLLCILYLMPRIEKRLKHANMYKLLSLHLFVTILLALFTPLNNSYSYIGCSIGLAMGLWMCRIFKAFLPSAHGAKEFIIRPVIAVTVAFLINVFIQLPIFFNILLCSIWISFGAPQILRHKLFLKEKS